ncbi:ferrous iron transporter B [Cyanobacterium aponinum UTEX 3222]|uniref:ferrous iron transporter B n=1 Tax=Cyanobacterium aponinum TaxID=379064 RepID=UPI0030905043|nr:ferrous iron transporter B [Cyanobacterium aponinum UTEX 3222]
MSANINYPNIIEKGLAKIEDLLVQEAELFLQKNYLISRRSLALLIIQKDREIITDLQKYLPSISPIEEIIYDVQTQLGKSITEAIAFTRQQKALEIEQQVLQDNSDSQRGIGEKLHQWMINPLTGFPILALVLYYGIYQFVGNFGAGTLVDLIEGFFEENINPFVNHIVAQIFPWVVIQDLFANDYGIITLGIRYATAIILPIVATYFLMFSLLEDTGYLPRLSLMLDRVFKTMGLSGRAVIPIVLGLGCDTMATVVTRTLETKRERIIATFLLALAIPCAAQWGVILGLLAKNPLALSIWAVVVLGIFLLAGFLTSRFLPGKPAQFYMEVPPLRMPKIENIITKTVIRMKWYFWEIIPLFIYASILIWFGKLTGLFDLIISWINPITLALDLPEEVSPIFLYGFFRRDYGAAGLFDIQSNAGLTGNQLVVCAIILTLFLPCIAQFQVMLKERGWKTTLAMVSFIFPFAFFIGYLVNQGLNIINLTI